MNAFAWTGIGIAAVALVAWFTATIQGLLNSPVVRWFLIGWSLVGLIVWGVLGALYLIVRIFV